MPASGKKYGWWQGKVPGLFLGAACNFAGAGLLAWMRRLGRSGSSASKEKETLEMIRTWQAGLTLTVLTAVFVPAAPAVAQDGMKHDGMVQAEKARALYTGKFHGKVHQTEGRATVYQQADGKLLLRLTNFKTSNGPDVHVVLVAFKDGSDDANSLKSGTLRVELGKLKGNEGDQNYEIPAGTDLRKFTAVSIYCERFNANFGAAPLEKF